MNEDPENKDVSASVSGESDVLGLLKKIQQHLVFLEKKIDTLIAQSLAPKFYPRSNNSFRRDSGILFSYFHPPTCEFGACPHIK